MDSSPAASQIETIYLQLAQYPILAQQIRQRMREQLFRRGVITPSALEQEVREKARLSQEREGLTNPLRQEDARQWQLRLQLVRDNLTDFYFAYNLPVSLFHQIVETTLGERSSSRPDADDLRLPFNPELAPVDLLLRQAAHYEGLPERDRAHVSHHLEEIMVVLVKSLITDQLGLVRVAKNVLTSADLRMIEQQRIGTGKIGGKAGGLVVSWKILHSMIQSSEPRLAGRISVPRSYYVGTNVFYDFLALNGLEYMNQKYKPADQIRSEYPQVQAAYTRGRFPEEIADRLREVLRESRNQPLIVRSSSLLEDSFASAFAGKYASFFCPNQGSDKENLRDLTLAIRRIYASIYSPDVLAYRRRVGLIDYDERMAILIQPVQGETYGRRFFPTLSGVAYSVSPIAWNPRLRRDEGFTRLVLGLGTRHVERVGDDYPRLVALSHPTLRPEVTPDAIEHYAQHYVDVLDLSANKMVTLPLCEAIDLDYPALRWVASLKRGDTLMPMFAVPPDATCRDLVLTFDGLLKHTDFVHLLKRVLTALAGGYGSPVDIEYAVTQRDGKPVFHLLQCRVQTGVNEAGARPIPKDIPLERTLFLANRMAPQGEVVGIEYIVYVDPEAYHRLERPSDRHEVARIVGRLNRALEGRNVVLIGPGRWGTLNIELGIPVTYSDIHNARALVEVAVPYQGTTPEPSYGTHFFQDLVEQHIYPIAVFPGSGGDMVNWQILKQPASVLPRLLPETSALHQVVVKVINVSVAYPGCTLTILMNGEQALAYLAQASAAQ